jgi:hypothetical protein
MNRLEVDTPFGHGGGGGYAVADRQPPYAPEAEISVLGGMLIDGDAVAKALEFVDDTMFYREANRRVFRAMARLFQRGQVVDPVTLGEELSKTDELEHVGGMRTSPSCSMRCRRRRTSSTTRASCGSARCCGG